MIWLWIIAALVLSLLPLINKKIDLAYYIWLLIPFDSYGLSIAGAVIKPYMILAFIIPIVFYARNKSTSFDLSISKGQLLAGIISVLIVTVNIFNCDDFAAVKAAIMLLVVYLCAQMSVSSTDCNKSEQLSDVFIASCFGCSIVFIVAYFFANSGINIGGLVAQNRTQDGMFMLLSNMSDGKYVEVIRLRGFAYDPNTMFIPFIFGISACVSRLFKKFNLYYIATFLMSVLCIVLSSSRMGLLCCILCIVITCAVSIFQSESIKKKVLSAVTVMSLCAGFLIAAISQWGQQLLSSLLSTYSNRSSLTDEYGRFSIWEECLDIYWDENPIFGVGLGQMSKMTTTERMTHNTWLEFICECGIIIGLIVITYFLSIAVIGWVRTKANHINHPDNTSYLALVIGYTTTLVSLVSVDNVTCSYLWFSALLMLKMAEYAKYKPCINRLTE